MSRSDQVMGLNSRAQKLVEGEQFLLCREIGAKYYSIGHIKPFNRPIYSSTVSKTEYDQFVGLEGNSYPLYKYDFLDKRVLYEQIQTNPWSSGPCFFLALKDGVPGNWVLESLWTNTEIEANI